METKFRPIPITVIDFLGILVPGFIWMVLLVVTFQDFFKQNGQNYFSPMDGLRMIVKFEDSQESWCSGLAVAFGSLAAGWIIKPFALNLTQTFTKWFAKFHPMTRKIPFDQIKFPYPAVYQNTPYYIEIVKIMKLKLKCDPEQLPGANTFSAAKRYLRLAPIHFQPN